MLEKLFTQLFEKLKKEKENDSISPSGCFSFFVERILEEKLNKINIVSSRTLTNYYNKYVEGKKDNTGKPKSELRNLIAGYLGFNDYTDFENFNEEKENSQHIKIEVLEEASEKKNETDRLTSSESTQEKPHVKKYIISTFILLLLISIFFINKYYNSNLEGCIIWVDSHFEKSPCTTENAIDNSIYNIDTENFRKAEVNPETTFMENSNPLYWYGKSATGKIEFFTNRGIHPETLDELKPVTEYIINKYVFKDNDNKTILN